MHQIVCRLGQWGFAPTPLGELQGYPRPLAGSEVGSREGEKNERTGEGKGKEENGKGTEGWEGDDPQPQNRADAIEPPRGFLLSYSMYNGDNGHK